MSKRISKRVREEAAMLCAIAASYPGSVGYELVADAIGASCAALDLAYEAWNLAHNEAPFRPIAERDAEAEDLLRTGWSPK